MHICIHVGKLYATMNYSQKPGFNLYQSRHCVYITYSVKNLFLKKSLCMYVRFYTFKKKRRLKY